MHFLVYERRKGTDEPVDDLGGLVSGISEWLGYLKELQKKGTVVNHWSFHGQHGSVTVFDVASGDELQEILKKNPMDEKWITREIYPAVSLEQAMEYLFKYMTGV